MATKANIACCVRVPASKEVTALHLAAEQVAAGLCCYHKSRRSITFMTVELLPECCVGVSAYTKVFGECRVTVNRTVVAELETGCFVRMKVKRGSRTVRKKALDARFLIKYLQEEWLLSRRVRLVFDIASYSPLTFCFQIKTIASAPVSAWPEQPSAEEEFYDTKEAAEGYETCSPVSACVQPSSAEEESFRDAQEPAPSPSVCTEQSSAEEEDFHDTQEPIEEPRAPPPLKAADTQKSINKMPRRYRRRLMADRGVILRRLCEKHFLVIEYNQLSGILKLEGRAEAITACQDEIDDLIAAWREEEHQ